MPSSRLAFEPYGALRSLPPPLRVGLAGGVDGGGVLTHGTSSFALRNIRSSLFGYKSYNRLVRCVEFGLQLHPPQREVEQARVYGVAEGGEVVQIVPGLYVLDDSLYVLPYSGNFGVVRIKHPLAVASHQKMLTTMLTIFARVNIL